MIDVQLRHQQLDAVTQAVAAVEDRVVDHSWRRRLALHDRRRAAEIEVDAQGIEVVVDDEVEGLRRTRIADRDRVDEGVAGGGVGVSAGSRLLDHRRLVGLQQRFPHRQGRCAGGALHQSAVEAGAGDEAVGDGSAGLVAGHVCHQGVELDHYRLDLRRIGVAVHDRSQIPAQRLPRDRRCVAGSGDHRVVVADARQVVRIDRPKVPAQIGGIDGDEGQRCRVVIQERQS